MLLYRLCLEGASKGLNQILDFIGRDPLRIAGWFAVLFVMAWIVSRLVRYEPMISGSGIPQLEGEDGRETESEVAAGDSGQVLWWFSVPVGRSCTGREGPSIQLGAMAGKAVSQGLDRGKTEERFLLTCGASAGLSAAFHAPLAGVMFSLEEVHKNFSVSVLVSVMASSLTADFLSSTVLGVDSVFQFDILKALPQEYYWMILLLGVVLGITGAFYNWFTLKAQSVYRKMEKVPMVVKMMIPFGCAGVLGLTVPKLLGSGHALIEELTHTEMLLSTVIFLLNRTFSFLSGELWLRCAGRDFLPTFGYWRIHWRSICDGGSSVLWAGSRICQ